MLSWSKGTFLDRKVPFPILLRIRYLKLLQDVKVIIIVSKKCEKLIIKSLWNIGFCFYN